MNTTQPTDILGRIFRMTAADIHSSSTGMAGPVSPGDLALCCEVGVYNGSRGYSFRRLDVVNDSIRCLSGSFVLWSLPSNMMEWKPSEFDLRRLVNGLEVKFGPAEMVKLKRMLLGEPVFDLHATIDEACRKRGWTDADAFIAWGMGVAALESSQQWRSKPCSR